MKENAFVIITTIIFLVGVGIGYLIPHDKSCVWDLWEDPRGCVIAWDDGTYSWMSRTIELGTLQPGESRVIRDGRTWSTAYSNIDDAIKLGDSNEIYVDEFSVPDPNQ